ncbi:MAG: glycosyltransferase family 2 protein [Nitrospirales bacterium]|nr:glycosyltransferase family 2 protein [Nitrospirales bacterium]
MESAPAAPPLPVSVVIITKNEEKNIERALRSIRECAEIILIDDFSTDATVPIARRYTDKVFLIPWQGYARQKQTGIDRATEPWVLVLDADECVTEDLLREIRSVVADSGYAGYFIPRRNFFLGRWIRGGGWWPDYTLRLFRKGAASMEQREVHEKITAEGRTGRLQNPLEHYTYDTLSAYLRKMDSYSTLAAREMHAAGRRFRPWHPLIKPPFTFFRMLVLQRGCRDGFYGFILALLYSFYTLLKYLKLWELQRSK